MVSRIEEVLNEVTGVSGDIVRRKRQSAIKADNDIVD